MTGRFVKAGFVLPADDFFHRKTPLLINFIMLVNILVKITYNTDIKPII